MTNEISSSPRHGFWMALVGGLCVWAGGCTTFDQRVEDEDSSRVRRNRDGEVTRLDLRGITFKLGDVAALSGMKEMRWLAMPVGTTDFQLRAVAGMERLESLSLFDAAITDKSVETLKKLKRLRHLNLLKTKLTDEAVSELRKENLRLSIHR